MTVTTAEYWDVDGTTLNTLAFNIETLGGRWKSTPLRGDNVKVPNRPGSIWVPKVPDEKDLSLAMWVRGADVNGLIPTAASSKLAQFNENWRQLMKLFSVRTRLLAVTKRWYEVPVTPVLRTATAYCEYKGTMDPSMFGRQLARFIVNLTVPDPYFYGTAITPSIPVGAGTVVANTGDDIASSMTIRFNGPLVNPILTNTSPNPDVWVKFGGTLSAGQYVDLDTAEFTAIKSDGTNVIGAISHSGAKRWMELLIGNNSFTLATDSGAGTVTLTLKPPYF